MSGLIVLALIVFFIPIGLAVLALARQGRLQSRLKTLEAKVAQIGLSGQDGIAQARAERPETPLKEDDSLPEIKAEDLDEQIEEPIDDKQPQPHEAEPVRAQPAQASASTTRQSVEQAIGAKWSVWVGGIALALGGIFLVRHSIEQGYLTPSVRMFLGALFASCLCGVGEYLRRKEVSLNITGFASAHIPGVLTAAGIMTGFATIYASYALYDFLNPLIAFILLAAVSVGALALAALHGPSLAALGLLGSFATPALVASDEPSAWTLFGYLLFVTAATYITARARGWLWLALGAGVGAVSWGFLWYVSAWTPTDTLPTALYIAGLLVLTVFVLKSDEPDIKELEAPFPPWLGADWPVCSLLAATSLLAVSLVRMDDYSTITLGFFTLIASSFLSLAWQRRTFKVMAPWAAIMFCFIYVTWHIPTFAQFYPPAGFDKPFDLISVTNPELIRFLIVGGVAAAGFAIVGYLGLLRHHGNLLWTATSAATPILIFTYAYLRATDFEHSMPFGLTGLAFAAAAIWACDKLNRTKQGYAWEINSGLYALAAICSLALSFTIFMGKGWLTIALALIVPGIAWVASQRKIRFLREAAGVLAGIVAIRLLIDPRIMGADLGTTPIFNWLLYGYGIPAAAFGLAARMFRKHSEDITTYVLEAASIFLTVVLVSLEIRHWLHDGDIYSGRLDLVEVSLNSLTWLGFSLGLQRLYSTRTSPIVGYATTALSVLALVTILIGHLLAFNPMITNENIGANLFFNDLLLAYALPALLCGLVFYSAKDVRHQVLVKTAGFTALILFLTYLSLEVRTLFHGSHLAYGVMLDVESYSYSAIWLLYGLALLGGGILFQTSALRYASIPIVVLTVLKVFLYDMANLTGIWQAGSFLGLGVVLIAIGLLYQRLIFPPDTPDNEAKNNE